MDSLSFGTLDSSSGAPRLSGTASKLDTAAIVEATYEAKRIPAVRLETKITRNEARLAAYQEMRSLLSDVQSALAPLRNPPGFFGARDNIFENKQAFFASSTNTDPSSLLGVSVGNSAQKGSFEISVDALAVAEKRATASTSSADQTLADGWNGAAAFSGTIDIGLDGGTVATIAVDGTMDIYDLRDAINAQSSTSRVRANVLQVASGDFRLILNAEDTGKAITIGDASGITGGFATTQLQASAAASFTIDGVAITRDGNQIEDLVDGVTIDLYKAESGTKVTVSIEPALGSVKEQIASFVESYNAFRDFVDLQSAVSATGEVAEDAVLFGDRAMRSVVQGLANVVGGGVTGLDPGALTSLRDIGITLDATNHLTVDDTELDQALLTDVAGVRGLFEFSYTSSSSDLAVFARTNALADDAFTIDIVDADADGVPESVTIDGIAAEIDGSTIRGVEGTAYEGLELLWIGSGSVSIDVRATQGVADRMFNFLDENLDVFEGSIGRASASLEDLNRDYAAQVLKIEERAERARSDLIERFSAMEAALSIANAMLEQIRSQVDAMTGNV
ncbi:MAG: flagellar filament capping protein FliD [Geminicoccaceae bacterium]|nr:flagellar filament capping protein FliD [Geminicoccaceae bacterium]